MPKVIKFYGTTKLQRDYHVTEGLPRYRGITTLQRDYHVTEGLPRYRGITTLQRLLLKTSFSKSIMPWA